MTRRRPGPLRRAAPDRRPFPPLVPSPPYAYRNKLRFFATGGVDLPFGLKPAGDPEGCLPVERCLLASRRLGYAIEEVARCVAGELARGIRLPFSAAVFQEMEAGLAVTVEGVPNDREYTGNWRSALQ